MVSIGRGGSVGLTSGDALLALAAAFSFTSTWLLNSVAYPPLSSVYPACATAATLGGVIASVVALLLMLGNPASIADKRVFIGTFALLVLSTLGMYLAVVIASPVLAVSMSSLRWMGCIMRDVYLGIALVGLGPHRTLRILMAAFLIRYGLITLFMVIPVELQWVAFFFCAPAGLLLLWPFSAPKFGFLDGWKPGHDEPEGQGGTVAFVRRLVGDMPVYGLIFILACVLFFHAALGYSTTYGAGGYDSIGPLSFALFAVVLGWAVIRHSTSIDLFYVTSFLAVLAGLLLAPVVLADNGIPAYLSNTLCEAGSSLFILMIWYMIARLGDRDLVSAVLMVCVVRIVRGLGLVLGSLSGALTNSLLGTSVDMGYLFVIAIAFAFAAFNFVGARFFSFDATVSGLVDGDGILASAAGTSHDVAAGDANPSGAGPTTEALDLEGACREISRRNKLTAREASVLELLAHGRNVAYIQEEYGLTRNTVKSYVATIYAKLEVHSHQEVIDLVEREALGETRL